MTRLYWREEVIDGDKGVAVGWSYVDRYWFSRAYINMHLWHINPTYLYYITQWRGNIKYARTLEAAKKGAEAMVKKERRRVRLARKCYHTKY